MAKATECAISDASLLTDSVMGALIVRNVFWVALSTRIDIRL